MERILKAEEVAMLGIGLYFLSLHHLGVAAWLWFFIFFSPDISMLGYLINNRIGANLYNFFHHRGIAIACVAIGYFLGYEVLISAGILLFAHASFDRIFGFGLKYPSSFNDTHLGKLKGGDKDGNVAVSV
jgi:hypothetical protein